LCSAFLIGKPEISGDNINGRATPCHREEGGADTPPGDEKEITMITVISHKAVPSVYGEQNSYRRYEFVISCDEKTFVAQCEGGEYDYEGHAPDDDEPIQVAIGEYMVTNEIDPGRVSR
jgi:hypothetical protein